MYQIGITHIQNQAHYNDTWCLYDFTIRNGDYLWHYALTPGYCIE